MKSLLFRALRDVIVHMAWLVPVKKDRVVLCSYGGGGIGNDPGKIALELLRRNPRPEVVWMIKDESASVPSGIRVCKIYDPFKTIVRQIFVLFRSAAMFSSARVIVCDTKGNFFKKSSGSVYVQTWHGDMPFKLIEGECADQLGKEHEHISAFDSSQTDVILSASSLLSEIYRKSFWLPRSCRIMEIGIPRNDIYFSSAGEEASVRKHLGIPSNVRIALYAPTFRDSGDTSAFSSLQFGNLKEALEERFGGEWRILVRMHPNVDLTKCNIHFDESVFNANEFADGGVVFKASDVLVTDVSSVIREFITMRKPIFVFFPDFDQYVKESRLLRPLFFSLPFKRCSTTTELADEIRAYDEESYANSVNGFLRDNGIKFFDNGNATKVIADYIIGKINA